MFTPKKSTAIIDMQNPSTAAKQLVAEARPLIAQLLDDIINSNLNSTQFPFASQQGSNLSKKMGLYAIVNTKTKKMYLGGTSDVSQRKGDHYRSFTKPARSGTRNRLSQAMLDDLKSGNINDFCFVPILILDQTQVSNLSADMTQNQQVHNFFDKQVEVPLLNELFISHPSNIYNTRARGAFVAGNAAGGSPASGQPDAPFSYVLNNGQNPPTEYAWESVSAGARCFNVTTKAVRHAREKRQILKKMTTADFNTFKGTKITNANAAMFATTNKAEYDILIKKLFPRVANRPNVP